MRSLWLALALLFASACDHDDHDYRAPQTCQLACQRAAECDRVPAGDCAASCRAPDDLVFALSPRYLDGVRRCLAAQSCPTVPIDRCEYDAALQLTPSKAAEALCRRARDDERSCGRTLDPVHCLDDVKLYDDPSLMRLSRCFDGPCADRAWCLGGAYGYGYPR